MKKLFPKLWMKIICFVLFIAVSAVLVSSVMGISYLVYSNAYMDSGRQIKQELASGGIFWDNMELAEAYCDTYLVSLQSGDKNSNLDYYENLFSKENSNFFFKAETSDGKKFLSNYYDNDYQYSNSCTYATSYNDSYVEETKYFDSYDEYDKYIYDIRNKYDVEFAEFEAIEPSPDLEGEPAVVKFVSHVGYYSDTVKYTLTGYVRSDLAAPDSFQTANIWLDKLLDYSNVLIAVALISLLLFLLLVVYLLCSAGHKEGVEGIHFNWIDKIPFDLYFAVLCVLSTLSILISDMGGDLFRVAYLVFAFFFCLLLFMSLLLTFATRAKSGAWWKNTIIYRVLCLLKRFLIWVWCGLLYVFGSMHLFWKAGLIWVGISLVELIVIITCSYGNAEMLMFWWFIEKLILTIIIVISVINMQKLKQGGEKLASGDFSYTLDLAHMLHDFKAHGENLNSIAGGMLHAVDERMKSERLKTELITNVSHDIKTPLTSIVNYVDLIKKEDVKPDIVKEYIEVLDRQSARLKKLTEDLVEASKASTGNIAMNMSSTDVNVLLSQAAAEYDEKFCSRKLALVLSLSEGNPIIFADGRLLWRVFDNVMSNVCKYAMEGTRVYISSKVVDGEVYISFKNVSKYALNISSEELMERFVRGDSSRSTEGSGLGLSIARSLTSLQKGNFVIDIDGDLFKAIISFPESKN